MNPRNFAVLTAVALAPAVAFAQEAAPAAPAPARDVAADVDTLTGKVDAASEKLAELESTLGGLKKLKVSGYVQGRYTWNQAADYGQAKSIDREGFYIRRGRLKTVYDAGDAEAAVQVDATGSGVSLKEAYVRLKLPANVTVDVGQILMPFGYEVGQVSSANLDVLERSAAIRKLLAGEYDRGAQLGWKWRGLTAKVGLFNGNGVDGGARDNDALKDVIGRVGWDFGFLNVGVSGWSGKMRVYQDVMSGTTVLLAKGDYDRTRVGVDAQAYLDLLPIGGTSVKAELIQGQTIIGSTATADLAKLAVGSPQLGWYVGASQAIFKNDAIAVRYDYYDENTDKKDGETGAKATGTFAVAYHHYFGGNVKASVLYELPRQVKGASGFTDPKDDALTLQLQASF